MKTFAKILATTAAAATLVGLTTGVASADMRIDEAVKLHDSGKIMPFEKLNEAVMKAHPGATITDSDLEDNYGKYVYQVEIRDKDGQEWDVDLDASTGDVLKSKQDD